MSSCVAKRKCFQSHSNAIKYGQLESIYCMLIMFRIIFIIYFYKALSGSKP